MCLKEDRWCSGITPVSHTGGSEFDPQSVHFFCFFFFVFVFPAFAPVLSDEKISNCLQFPSKEGEKKKKIAPAGNRTRITCLEGKYPDHWTTGAVSSNALFLYNRTLLFELRGAQEKV